MKSCVKVDFGWKSKLEKRDKWRRLFKKRIVWSYSLGIKEWGQEENSTDNVLEECDKERKTTIDYFDFSYVE